MESISIFLNISKFADIRLKNADVSKFQGVCRVIYVVFMIFVYLGIFVYIAVQNVAVVGYV